MAEKTSKKYFANNAFAYAIIGWTVSIIALIFLVSEFSQKHLLIFLLILSASFFATWNYRRLK